MRIAIVIIGLCFLLMGSLYARQQENDFGKKYNSTKTEEYIQLAFSNDMFFKTDYYYSNGLQLDLQLNRLALKISDKLPFFEGGQFEKRYKYKLSQDIYTPEHYTRVSIDYKDRPYAGVLTLSYSEGIYTSTSKHTMELKLGTIGKPTGTKQTQNSFHTAIDNELARGWENQISTDMVLNLHYSFSYRVAASAKMDLTGGAIANIGTLNTDFGANLRLRVGKRLYQFDKTGPLIYADNNSNWQYFITAGLTPRFIIYNATLQGGMINRTNNAHVLRYEQLENFVLEIETGIVVGYKRFQTALLFQSNSPEFEGAKMHRYGTLELRYTF